MRSDRPPPGSPYYQASPLHLSPVSSRGETKREGDHSARIKPPTTISRGGIPTSGSDGRIGMREITTREGRRHERPRARGHEQATKASCPSRIPWRLALAPLLQRLSGRSRTT